MCKIVLFLFAAAGVCLFSGCATIFRGTTEDYRITSNPSGALVTFSTGETCETPCVMEKKRNESFAVKIEKSGYKPIDIAVDPRSCNVGGAAMVGNILMFGSVIWASIDSLTGATQELSPNPCRVELVPEVEHPEG